MMLVIVEALTVGSPYLVLKRLSQSARQEKSTENFCRQKAGNQLLKGSNRYVALTTFFAIEPRHPGDIRRQSNATSTCYPEKKPVKAIQVSFTSLDGPGHMEERHFLPLGR